MACFALGSRGLSRRAQKQYDGDDVMWLDVAEIGVLSIPKVIAWWRSAASVMSQFTHAAKVDDDTFLNVPNLLHAVGVEHARLSTRPQSALCFGPLAHAGYSPSLFRMCGWSWQRSIGSWRRQKCAQRGFSPPHPFPLGALQLLSRNLVTALGTSEAVRQFAAAADANVELRKRESNEDVAIGYWIATLAADPTHPLNVSYSNINDRAPNLGCFRNAGLYRNPTRSHIVVHRIKGAAGHGYVWKVLHGLPHEPIACVKAADIEVKRASLLFTPSFEARVRAGTAAVHFDQKTNQLSMTFGRPQSAADIPGLVANSKPSV